MREARDMQKEWENRWHWHSHAIPDALERSWALISTESGPERQKFRICHMKNSEDICQWETITNLMSLFHMYGPSLFVPLTSHLIGKVKRAWSWHQASIWFVKCSKAEREQRVVSANTRHTTTTTTSPSSFTVILCEPCPLANKLVPLYNIINKYVLSAQCQLILGWPKEKWDTR